MKTELPPKGKMSNVSSFDMPGREFNKKNYHTVSDAVGVKA